MVGCVGVAVVVGGCSPDGVGEEVEGLSCCFVEIGCDGFHGSSCWSYFHW